MSVGETSRQVAEHSLLFIAEPSVALVEGNVVKHGTRRVAEAYLKYLYSPTGQTLAAKHYYRPRDAKSVPAESMRRFPRVELFTIDEVFGGWQKAPGCGDFYPAARRASPTDIQHVKKIRPGVPSLFHVACGNTEG